MKIYLGTINKRDNSTKQKNKSEMVEYDCILKAESSILSPSISLELGTTFNPSGLNYAYIEEFSRYYWVTDWTWVSHRIWAASLQVDVLASYKSDILASEKYIVRSSSHFNGYVIDGAYPTTSTQSISVLTSSAWNPWVDSGKTNILIESGCFILGVISDGTSSAGAVSYFAVRPNRFAGLVYNLNRVINSFISTVGSIAKAVIDPLQYIVSCKWVPVPYTSFWGQGEHDISLAGYGSLDIPGKLLGPSYSSFVDLVQWSISVTEKHPQSSRGSYLNASPYTSYTLIAPPFGAIVLDSYTMRDAESVNVKIRIDLIGGDGYAEIYAGNKFLKEVSSRISVDIPLSQVTQDVLGAASTIGDMFLPAANSENPLSERFAKFSFSGINSAIESLSPKAEIKGTEGSYMGLSPQWKLIETFRHVVLEDIAENGRPVMEILSLSGLSGFCMVQDGGLSCGATLPEEEAIKTYLEGGFFIE